MSKSTIKAVAAAIVLFLVLGAILGVVGYYSDGFKNWDKFNPVNWFKKPDSNAGGGGSIMKPGTSDGVSVVCEEIAKSDFAVYGISEHADSAYELKATIQPDFLTNKTINWSVSWKNANSDWASGKIATNYVSFNKTTSQSGEAVIATCHKDFGEQIMLTAVAAADSEKKGICFVDYRMRILGVDFYYSYDGDPDGDRIKAQFDSDGVLRLPFVRNSGQQYVFSSELIYSNFTINEFYDAELSYTFSDNFGGERVEITNNFMFMLDFVIEGIVEPELNVDSLSFINGVRNITFNQNVPVIISNIKKSYDSSSTIQKTHSRVINAYEGLMLCYNALSTPLNIDKVTKAIDDKNWSIDNYSKPSSKTTFMGVEFASLEDFLREALACNAAGKGILEFGIKCIGNSFNYDFKLPVAFTSESLNIVTDILMDSGGIIV